MPPTLANLIWVIPAEGSELRLCYQLYAAMGVTLAVFLFYGPQYPLPTGTKITAEAQSTQRKEINPHSLRSWRSLR